MQISCIVPVYNVKQYLSQCVESIINQSYKNIEIILIDDGSTDGSGEICDKYVEKDCRIKVYHKENGGQAKARNIGINYAMGEYIVFLDADDYWEKNFLEDLVGRVQKNPKLECIIYKFRDYYQKDNVIRKCNYRLDREYVIGKTGLEVMEYILQTQPKYGWMAWLYLVKREFIVKYNIFFEEGKLYEDVLWTPQLFIYATYMDYYDKYVYNYRHQREGSTTSNFTLRKGEDILYIVDKWISYIKKEDKWTKNQKKLFAYNLLDGYLQIFFELEYLSVLERQVMKNNLNQKRYLLKNISLKKILKYSTKGNCITYILLRVFGIEIGSYILSKIYKIYRSIGN